VPKSAAQQQWEPYASIFKMRKFNLVD